ncbi:MAG: hypothetical protein DMD69_13725 [Gemmatimonadetes bacterium]|nr:MAG: hypothetical protein DMD69_13725 [Gemmatimonadota bacterium]
MNRKGFTLIELLIVVVIIGILAAIAIPKFANTKEKAYLASMKSDLRNLVTAEEAYFADSVKYSATNPVDGQHAAGRRAHGGWLDSEHHQRQHYEDVLDLHRVDRVGAGEQGRRAEVPVSLRA